MQSPVDALRLEEIARIRIFARLMVGLTLFGACLIPFMGGDPLARDMYIATIASVSIAYVWLLWITQVPSRYTELRVGCIAQIAALGAIGTQYFFGVFSPAAIVTGIGLMLYSMGSGFKWTFITYLNVASSHGIMAGLMIGGVIEDRGLITGDHVEPRHQVILQMCVQFVYMMSFVVGRAARAKTLDVLTRLERTAREVAERDALLAEARQELERAAWVGGPGRFTDQQLGSFTLGNVIGRGAMGEIYAAVQDDTGIEAAVKLLHRNVLANPKHVARFVREATIVSSLDVDNVVKVLEVTDIEAPVPYLAMERLYGEDLAHILQRKRRLPLGEVVSLIEQVGAGLSAAHEVGIVHRDVKPHNLFAHAAGDAPAWKILDFGVSKLADSDGTLTEGNVVGTPAYMAPEQACGDEVDHRVDVYALAAIAYRCLTGRPPAVGSDVHQVLYAVVHQAPARPTTLVPELPSDVDAALAIGLAKRPADRFQHIDELVSALISAARSALPSELRRRAKQLLGRQSAGPAA